MGIYGPPLADPRRPSALLEPLDPIAITGADFDVSLSGQTGLRPWTIKLANESPYALRVDVGGHVDWLGPWTADVLPTGGATVMHVHPVSLAAPIPVPAAQSSVLLVTLAPQGEDILGTYPMALSRQTAVFNNRPLIGSPLAVAAGATSAPTNFTVPPGATGIRIDVSSDGGFSVPHVYLLATNSGAGGVFANYYGLTSGQAAPMDVTQPLNISVDPQLDPVVQLTVSVQAGGPNVHIYVSALYGIEAPTVRVTGPPIAWQAPSAVTAGQAVSPGLGNDFTMQPATSNGGAVRLFELLMDTNSGVATRVTVWNGPSANGLLVGTFLQATGSGAPPMRQQFNGCQVTNPGNALVGRLDAGAAGTSVWFNVPRGIQ